MTIKQYAAVILAVRNTFPEGTVPETGRWTQDQKDTVYAAVFEMFKSRATVHSKNPDDAALLKYIPGLVNNHVRKERELNGGMKYKAKRPGSRTGSTDESLKAMRSLLSVTTDPDVRAQIQAAIDTRVTELKPKTAINISALPEALRHLVPQ